MRVKICGITTVADAQAAAQAGADAIGLNFVAGPRRIDIQRAESILRALPPMITPVALAKLEDECLPDPLVELLAEFWVSHLQVYGDVTSRSLTRLADEGFRPIPVLAVRDETFAASAPEWLVEEVVEHLERHGAGDVEEVATAEESTGFPIPRELRR